MRHAALGIVIAVVGGISTANTLGNGANFFDDFESGAGQWQIPGSMVITSSQKYCGSNSQTFASRTFGGDAFTFPFGVTPGQTYYLHVAYMTFGNAGYIGIDQFPSGGEVWMIGSFAGDALSDFDHNTANPGAGLGTWKVYTQAYVAPGNITSVRIKVEDWAGGLGGGPIFFDNIEWSTSPVPSYAVAANAGPDLVVPCGGSFQLDGTQSTGPIFSYAWTEGQVLLGTSAVQPTNLPGGAHVITLTVTDDCGNSSTDTANVVVLADTTPPTITSISANPASLGTTGSMTPVALTVTAIDNCDPNPACSIVRVTRNGSVVYQSSPAVSTAYVQNVNGLTCSLKADGGSYVITVQCMDAAGNSSLKTVIVGGRKFTRPIR